MFAHLLEETLAWKNNLDFPDLYFNPEFLKKIVEGLGRRLDFSLIRTPMSFDKLPGITDFGFLQQSQNSARFWFCLVQVLNTILLS